MSDTRHNPLNSPSGDLQEIIAAKISLREEIKAELRSEFFGEIGKLRDLGAVRLEYIKAMLAENRRETELRWEQGNLRFEQRYEAQEAKHSLARETSDRAINKAEVAIEKRLDEMNEFRATLTDQQKTFVPRNEADARFTATLEKFDILAASVSTAQLDMKSMIKREDLSVIQADIMRLRDRSYTGAGKEQVWAIVGSAGLSIGAMLVVLFTHASTPSQLTAPIVGADTKRIDDLITIMNEQNRSQNSRLDALSARLTGLTPSPTMK